MGSLRQHDRVQGASMPPPPPPPPSGHTRPPCRPRAPLPGQTKRRTRLSVVEAGDAFREEAAADAADTDATDTADEAALDADILAAEEEEGDIIEEDADTDSEGDYMNEGDVDDE